MTPKIPNRPIRVINQIDAVSELLLENSLKGMLYELIDAVSELLLENSLKGIPGHRLWKGCQITSPAFGPDGMTHDGAK